ncbi:putative pyridoxine 5'-phosphate oxidase superfamily flavin-nucleotide-binding protein [Oxalobacteraceae bacterium GrIS 1.11]
MSRAFAEISFTPAVKAAQSRNGSRAAHQHADHDPQDRLDGFEASFIAQRDSFYQATVGETGWPYVQHRGGPPGFLTVLDERTIAYADFRGNMQYLSVGNLGANDKISLILMDYPKRRRLKIWGRARIIEAQDDLELMARLEMPAYRGRVERAIVIDIEAFDWNCPQHISPRYTQAEVERLLAPLLEENRRLKAA